MFLIHCSPTFTSTPTACRVHLSVAVTCGRSTKLTPCCFWQAGLSAGYGMCLWGESTTGCVVCADVRGEAGHPPEDVGVDGARLLLEEIRGAGCVDTPSQWVALALMALTPQGDASAVRTGPLSEHSIACLRLIRDFFGVMFRVQPDAASGSVRLSCMGVGFQNLSKKISH